MNQLDIFETKEDALEALEIARKEYLVRARRAARVWCVNKSWNRGNSWDRSNWPPITVDDVRTLCPPPEDIDPRVMGAIFNTPDWEATGYIKSTRKTCHGRPIAQFRYVGS